MDDTPQDTAPARRGTVVVDDLDVERLLALTGWHLEARGACRGDVCAPLGAAARTDPSAVAAAIGVALVHDDELGLWAVGPEVRGRTLTEARLPDLVLPTIDGEPFALRSLLGRRGVLFAWASW